MTKSDTDKMEGEIASLRRRLALDDDDPDRHATLVDMTILALYLREGLPLPGDSPEILAERRLGYLGKGWLARFERTGAVEDLADAVETLREAQNGHFSFDDDRLVTLVSFTKALATRVRLTCDASELGELLEAERSAVAMTAEDHPRRPVVLGNLGAALSMAYNCWNDPRYLDEAIAAFEDVAAYARRAPPGHADPDLPGYESDLGAALAARYECTGALVDLNEGIDHLERAANSMPPWNPRLAGSVSNLGGALVTRARRDQSLPELDHGIARLKQAQSLLPDTHPDRYKVMHNLGEALRTRYSLTKDGADLVAAIDALSPAAHAAAGDGTHEGDMAAAQISFGAACFHAYLVTGERRYAEQSRLVLRAGLAATPPHLANRATGLLLLGLSHLLESPDHVDRSQLDQAISAFRDAADTISAPPSVRVQAARLWGQSTALAGDWSQALEAHDVAIALLPKVAPLSLDRADQELRLIGSSAGLSSDAAACSVRAGEYDRAAELWEQGRAVVLAQALDTRTDLTVLAETHEHHARRFAELRYALDHTGGLLISDGAVGATTERLTQARRQVDRRREWAVELEQLLTDIRKLEGFERFLFPPTVDELAGAAQEGPIVMFSVSEIGSDALILSPEGVRAVPLPAVTPEEVRNHVAELVKAVEVKPAGQEAEERVRAVLAWLWDDVTAPVLDRLDVGHVTGKSDHPPRVWWCPSGLLSFLPLHAAGHHETASQARPLTVLDRVVSSYTPTVRSLVHARRGGGDAHDRLPRSLLAVAVPQAPGEVALHGVEDEEWVVRSRFGGAVESMVQDEATRERVLSGLKRNTWAHFACHGYADVEDPSASRLLLVDEPLTVADVARLSLESAEFAYLSACTTMRPGARLPDEAVHLASAFNLAGYRHVVATLWPIDDQLAVDVAKDVYKGTRHDRPRAHDSAFALHRAVRSLRRRRPLQPSAWAAHIHVGA